MVIVCTAQYHVTEDQLPLRSLTPMPGVHPFNIHPMEAVCQIPASPARARNEASLEARIAVAEELSLSLGAAAAGAHPPFCPAAAAAVAAICRSAASRTEASRSRERTPAMTLRPNEVRTAWECEKCGGESDKCGWDHWEET